MKEFRKSKITGGRVIKTGIAVFITAVVCHLLHFPPVFSVITAIVSIEYTAADSLKKGLIRLPASAIGAGIALSFAFLFGETAFAYAISAILTIFVCFRLRLQEGILVATITAVAMIPATNDHFLLAFVERLGTTVIAIVVSTFVNFFVLPPNYLPIITDNCTKMLEATTDLLEKTIERLLYRKNIEQEISKQTNAMKQTFYNTNKLANYQRVEYRYRKTSRDNIRYFHLVTKQLSILQQFIFHLGNLQYAYLYKATFSSDEKQLLMQVLQAIKSSLKNPDLLFENEFRECFQKLEDRFWHLKEEGHFADFAQGYHGMSPRAITFFELLTIQDILQELVYITKEHEKRGEAKQVSKQ